MASAEKYKTKLIRDLTEELGGRMRDISGNVRTGERNMKKYALELTTDIEAARAILAELGSRVDLLERSVKEATSNGS